MEAYLDNAATTRAFPEVAALVNKIMCEDYGNPSSLHQKGVDAEKYIREAGDIIASSLKTKRGNIVFTSGGTESNNMAIIGGALANRRRGKHIITTCFEHAAVYQPCQYLQDFFDYEITALKVDSMGHVNLDELKESIRDDTVLVSTMLVNNEVGAILDIEKIGHVIKTINPQIIYHVDAIQAYGKMKIQPHRCHVDMLSASGHKIHGPKGTGFLYIADGVKVHPYIHGGGQQKGRRSGTENVPGIAGMALAAKMMYDNQDEKIKKMYDIKKELIDLLLPMDGVTVNACNPDKVCDTAPHIISVSVDSVRSEVLLHALEESGVYISSGSACSSNHPGISSSLQAIGVPGKLLDSTIRFSLSVDSTSEEIHYAVDKMKELLPILRKYTRK